MIRFKRWTTGIVARIDNLIVQVENHDALVAGALAEFEQNVARARVQLGRVRRDGEALARTLAETRESATRWRERARKESDETRALECLRRSKHAERRAVELARRKDEHDKTIRDLERDVHELEERMIELREQRNAMRARATRASAFNAIQGGVDPQGDLGRAFERWETQVAETEILSGCATDDRDSLDERYASEEERAELALELRALREET
jgi:phage shock protein A